MNLGWVGNTNALLKIARADYLLFAFHGDLLNPDYVARCVAELEANPRAVVAFSDLLAFYQEHPPQVRQYTDLHGIGSRVERCVKVLRRRGHCSTTNRGVFRSEAAAIIGGLRRNLTGEFSADWPWTVHMSLLGESIRIPAILVEKYYKRSSLSRGWHYAPRYHLASALSCTGVIRRADLTFSERRRLYGELWQVCHPWLRGIRVRERRMRR